MQFIAQNLAPIMFVGLFVFLLIGFPVAFSLGACGLVFATLGIALGVLPESLMQALPLRLFGIMQNDTLLAIPFFTLMGLILERSGMAEDLLETIGQLFGPIRGGLALAVVFVGALPTSFDVRVGGSAAEFVDQQEAIGSRLLLAIGLLVGLTLIVLWLMTGSVVLPVKAVLMNALTVGAALAPLTIIYQGGHLTGLLGYTPNGGVEPSDFLVTAAIVFALSTDYGVFLLGRI